MHNKIFIIVPVLLVIIIRTEAANLLINPNDGKAETARSYVFEESEFQIMANQVQLLKEVTDNMRLKMELNSHSLQKELQEIKELLSKENAIDSNKSTEDCSRNNPCQVQLSTSLAEEFASLKSEILEKIQQTFVNCQCKHTIRLSDVSHLLKSEISDMIAANVTNEITKVQLQMNELSSSVKSEMDYLKETIQPQINSIANSTQSLRSAIEENSELFLNSLANITNKPPQHHSCAEALRNGGQSGVYKLHLLSSNLEPFDVYCLKDPMNGPAWTVVQRRQDGSVDFDRSWEEYQHGFGDLKNEFFVGLDKLHALTNQAKPQQLWIQLEDWEGAARYAKYTGFMVGNAAGQYNLTKLGAYCGDAGDSLKYHLGAKFSTRDSDNDNLTYSNCAEILKSGWWFRSCTESNLNGKYRRGEIPNAIAHQIRGIQWEHWHGDFYGLKYSHMAVRPSDN